jgi:hypothetical protein
MGVILLKELAISYFAFRSEKLLIKVKLKTIMRELRILRVLLDSARDEMGCKLTSNPARKFKAQREVISDPFTSTTLRANY